MDAEPDTSCLDAALDYAERGWRILPIRAGAKTPANSNGSRGATCMADVIRKWYAGAPNLGVGIAGGGPARLVVIDVDGDVGRTTLAALEQQIGVLPTTLASSTRNGGEHRYFRIPSSINVRFP